VRPKSAASALAVSERSGSVPVPVRFEMKLWIAYSAVLCVFQLKVAVCLPPTGFSIAWLAATFSSSLLIARICRCISRAAFGLAATVVAYLACSSAIGLSVASAVIRGSALLGQPVSPFRWAYIAPSGSIIALWCLVWSAVHFALQFQENYRAEELRQINSRTVADRRRLEVLRERLQPKTLFANFDEVIQLLRSERSAAALELLIDISTELRAKIKDLPFSADV
jgi:hypothetical protein